MKPIRGLLIALASLILLAGCTIPQQWTVLSQATPNALLRQLQFAVAPIDFAGVVVGATGGTSEDTYLADKSAEQRETWGKDKVAMNAKFVEELTKRGAEAGLEIVPAEGPVRAPFVIRAHVVRIEPGFYAVLSAQPASVKFDVTISSSDGKPVDHIVLDILGGGFTLSQRLASAGMLGGMQMSMYLHKRTFPGAR